jgi:hypothetical protein
MAHVSCISRKCDTYELKVLRGATLDFGVQRQLLALHVSLLSYRCRMIAVLTGKMTMINCGLA